MLKITVRNLLLMTLPLTLAVGCMHSRPLAPTSTRPVDRVYADGTTGSPIILPSVPAPAGASPAGWDLAQQLRGMFTADATLAPYPSEVKAIIDKESRGIVTLRGTIINPQERKRLHDRIAQVSGVTQVDDQLVVGAQSPQGDLDIQGPVYPK